jgi:hypothetical protein
MRVISDALDELASENAREHARRLAAEVARFAAALEMDAIVPMDF